MARFKLADFIEERKISIFIFMVIIISAFMIKTPALAQSNQPPVASTGGPYVADLGSAIALDGTGSYDPDTGDSIVSYSWNVADGTIMLTGPSPSLSAAQVDALGVGTYPVGLTVTDSFGATDTASTTLAVYDNRPVATFTASPNPAACNQSVSFDASSSSHGRPDRSIVSYAWAFGDGNTGTGVTVDHTYNTFGTYTATLTVTDNNYPPKTDSTTSVVTISQGNQAPVANAGGPYTTYLGTGVSLNGTSSSDPNSACGDSIVSYSWDVAYGTYMLQGPSPSLTAAQVDGVGVGTYPVSLLVYDGFGANGTASPWLTINQYTLTVNAAGNGFGTVQSSVGGINYHYQETNTATTTQLNYGTLVTLTATPDEGSIFEGWSGDPDCADGQITVDVAKTCIATFSSNCVAPPSGLVGWWSGNDHAFDLAGTNNGTMMNGATYGDGYVGKAFSFDGVDDYVSIPQSANLPVRGTNSFTIDAWVNHQGYIGDSVNFNVFAFVTSDNVQFYIDRTYISVWGVYNHVLQIPHGVDPAAWNHYAFVRDGNTWQVYVNGAQVGSDVTDSRDLGTPTTTQNIGTVGDANGQWAKGLIDEVEIYNRALSAEEIAAIYDAGVAGKCSFTLTANARGNGSGTVQSNVGNINYTYNSTTTGSTIVGEGIAVTLTATAATGSTVAWSGDCDSTGGSTTVGTCTINSMNADKIAIATFTLDHPPGNQPPVASAGGPYVVDLGPGITLDGAGSYDPDPGDMIVEYEWDLDGDGVFDDANGAFPSLSPQFISALGIGTFPVSLRVRDSFGVTNTAWQSTTLTIYDNMPVATFTASPNPAACNQSVSFDASSSSHGRPDRSIVSYAWAFGDGESGTGVTVQHTYNRYGSYAVTLTVTDNNVPARRDSTTSNITINQGNQAPEARPGGPYTTYLGTGVSLNGTSSSDPNAACGDSIVSYSWDVADGTYMLTGPSPSLTAAQVDALGVGTYPVSLLLHDAFGAPSTASTTLTINQYTLTINAAGNGFGTVQSSVGGINYHYQETNTATTTQLNYGTLVTLTATPDEDSIFEGWTGDPDCADGEVTMDAAKACIATFSKAPPDPTPDPFTFIDRTGVGLSAVTTSNTITISGINTAAPISITGGQYAINGGSYTSVDGTVSNGNTVTVQQTSSASFSTTTDATLTIGSVSDTFSVTTKAAPPDTMGPSLSITSHNDGQHLNTSSITLSGTASDAGKGDNGIQQVTIDGSRASNDTAIGSGTANWSKTVSLSTGANTLTVVAYDDGVNHNTTTQSITIYYDVPDTTPPNTTITGGPSGTIATNSATFTYTGSDTLTSTDELVYATYLQGYDSGWSSFSSSTSKSYSNLPNGSYTFQVKAKDQAGYEDASPATSSFTVNYTGCTPSVVATLPIPGTILPYYDEGLEHDGINLWVSVNRLAPEVKVYEIDTSSGIILRSYLQAHYDPASSNVIGLAYDRVNHLIYNHVYPSGPIYAVDANTLVEVPGSSFSAPASWIHDIAIDSTNQILWAIKDTGTVYKINPSNGSVLGSFTSPGNIGVTWDGTYLWISGGGYVYQIDPDQALADGNCSNAIVQQIYLPDIGAAGGRLAWDGGFLWTASSAEGVFYEIDVCYVKVLLTQVSPVGAGTVGLTPPGGIYDPDTLVTLTAVSATGYQFDHWSGDLSGSMNPTQITMDTDKTVTANFVHSGGIALQSPIDGEICNSCTLATNYQPIFTWSPTGVYTGYKILFSRSPTDFTTLGIKVASGSATGTSNSWKPSSWNWKTILKSSNNNGSIRPIYWKVVGTKSDRTKVESEVRSFSIGSPQAQVVSINGPLDGAILDPATPPTFDFHTNCNTKFRLEISSLSDFSVSTKIKGFNFTTVNPNLVLSLQKTLPSFQWTGVKKLIGAGQGYFRIKAWDGINRETVSDIRTFTIQ